MRGLPCTGKTTYAKEKLADHPGKWVHVCRDDIRRILFGGNYPFSFKNEKLVKKVEEAAVSNGLTLGKSVIIDSTHLSEKHINKWNVFLNDWQQKNKDIDLVREIATMSDIVTMQELRRTVSQNNIRNIEKIKFVPNHVIYNMAFQFNLVDYYKEKRPIIVCDIDGTIADVSHRLHYLYDGKGPNRVKKEDRDWDAFFDRCNKDALIESTKEKVLKAAKDYGVPHEHVIFVTARPELYRQKTHKWLRENMSEFPANFLIMRGENDRRPDYTTKEEIYHRFLKNKNIVKLFDDRPAVIEMWRKHGLPVEDVGQGIDF